MTDKPYWYKQRIGMMRDFSFRLAVHLAGFDAGIAYLLTAEHLHLRGGMTTKDDLEFELVDYGLKNVDAIIDAFLTTKILQLTDDNLLRNEDILTECEQRERSRSAASKGGRSKGTSSVLEVDFKGTSSGLEADLKYPSTILDIEIDIEKEQEVKQKTVLHLGDFEGFDVFWSAYDKKRGKPNAMKQWSKLTDDERRQATEAASMYALATPKQYRKDPERWLRGKHWHDEIITTTTNQPTHGERTTIAPEYYAKLAGEIRELESGADTGTTGKLVQTADPATRLVAVNGDTRRQATSVSAHAPARPRTADMGATAQSRVVGSARRLDDEGDETDT